MKLTIKSIILTLLTLLVCSKSYAQVIEVDTYCFDPSWPYTHYRSSTKGEVIIYKVGSKDNINATSITCILGKEFLSRAHNIPEKFITGIISSDYTLAYIIKWSIVENFIMLIEMSTDSGIGIYSKYPLPLRIIKNIITSTPLPTVEDLPVRYRKKLITNTVSVTQEDLYILFNTPTTYKKEN